LQTEGQTGRETGSWRRQQALILQIFAAKAPKLEYKAVNYSRNVRLTVEPRMDIALSLDLIRNCKQGHKEFKVSENSSKFFKLHLTDITEKNKKVFQVFS
jgi:hypothetical protein